MRHFRTIAFACTACFWFLCFSNPAQARDLKMIFWYPGEAGSTDEAQPVLDAFLALLNPALKPDALRARYFNTVKEGAAFIAKERPVAGIISFAAWSQHPELFKGTTVVLAALPSPHAQTSERYALVGMAKKLSPQTKLFSSEPLSSAFIRTQLFDDLPDGIVIEQTPQMFSKLKRIANRELEGAAILTPSEAAALMRLSSPWTKALQTISTSKPVPTARVVLFDPGWKEANAFTDALLAISKDPQAAEALEEIRLQGFAQP